MVMLDQFSSEHVNDILSQQEGELACTMFMGVPTMYVKMMGRLERKRGILATFGCWLRVLPHCSRENLRGSEDFWEGARGERGNGGNRNEFFQSPRGKKKPGSIGLPLPSMEVSEL